MRTLIVEDSRTVRELLVAIFSNDPRFTVIGEAANGEEAVQKTIELAPDLITMDVHMPILDGIDATRMIMGENPTPIIVVSSVAPHDVELSLNALQAGALMIVEKPADPKSPQFTRQSTQLLEMAKAMSGVKVVRRWSDTRSRRNVPASGPQDTVRLVAIGTSTGGPAALRQILIELPRTFPVPIVVVQHIATGFVEGLVRWLSLELSIRVTVAKDGEQLMPGTAYLAPDGHHLGVTRDSRVRLSSVAPIGGFRPSADHLFESCAQTFGRTVLAVILTGMGRDGTEGLRAVHAAGGHILAQDEATSVVYGMAREAVRAGIVDETLPLDDIARRLVECTT